VLAQVERIVGTMPSSWRLLILGLAAVWSPAACKKATPAVAAAQTSEPERAPEIEPKPAMDWDHEKASRCLAVAHSLGAFGAALGAVAIDGLSGGEAENTLAACLAAASTTQDQAGCLTNSPEEARAVEHKAIAECMTWPDDMIDCMTTMDLDNPRCEVAYRSWLGLVEESPPAAEGKTSAWTAELDEEIWDVVSGVAGTVVMTEMRIAGLDASGGERWRIPCDEPEHMGWLVQQGRTVVYGDEEGRVITVDAATGEVVQTVTLPQDADGEPMVASRAVAGPDGVWMVLDGASVALLSDGKVEARVEAFSNAPWDGPSDLRLDSQGRIWLTWWLDGQTRVFSPQGEQLLRFDGKSAGPPSFAGDEVFVQLEESLVVVRPDRCEPGVVASASDLPTGCLVRQIHVEAELDGVEPTVTDDAIIAVGEGYAFAFDRDTGKRRWKQMLDGNLIGPFAVHEGELVGIESWTMETPSRVVVIDPATGAPIRHSAMVGHERSFMSDPWLIAAPGRWLVADKMRVYAFPKSL